MKNIAVDDLFEEQLWKIKKFFSDKYEVGIHGTRITKAIGKLIQEGFIFPLNEEGMLDILEIKKNRKISELEVILKIRIPTANGHKQKPEERQIVQVE